MPHHPAVPRDPDPHAAALVQDHVAIAYLGDRARPNFLAVFHPIEQRFLWLCRAREGQIDVCALVADLARTRLGMRRS